MVVSQDGWSNTSAVTFRSRLREQVSLLSAAFVLQSVYYRQLLQAYVRNLRPLRPLSSVYAFNTVRRIHRVKGYTALLPLRLAALYRLSREIDRRSISGDVVECGVYNGGSAALLASVCTRSHPARDMWLFDSFEGLPPPTEEDGEKAQACGWWCHGDLAMVKEIFGRLGIPDSRIHIVKGWFHDTFPAVQIGDIALLHIDADWYESVKLCLERFYDHVMAGGYIVIDDYGHWEGCRRATEEFMNGRGIDIPLTRVDYTGRYFRKPG